MSHNESSPLLPTATNQSNYRGLDVDHITEEAVIIDRMPSSSSSTLDSDSPVTFVNPNDELHAQRLQGSSLFAIFLG